MTITVYKLHHATDNTKECYVGSTGDFKARKHYHKSECNNTLRKHYKYKVYLYIRENGGYDSWTYTILSQIDTPLTKLQRLKHERELTVQHTANLNQQKAGAWTGAGSMLEYQRIPERKEYAKQYNIRRADTNNTCERCGLTYRGKTGKNSHQRTLKCKQLTHTRIKEQIQILIEQMEMYKADTLSRIEGFKSELQTLVVE